MARGATKEQLKRASVGDYLKLDPRLVGQRRATLHLGGTGADRLKCAAEEVVELLRRGADPAEVVAVCPTPRSAEAFSRELAQRADGALRQAASRVEATCARALAFRILADDAAQKAAGCAFSSGRPRLLSAFELDFVLEDLKTIGMRPKRLREVLKFLYRGWTELADESEDWLVTVEEHDLVAMIGAELSYFGAIIEPQASNLALKAVRAVPGLAGRFGRRHVVAVAYECLSRASQLLLNALALESVTVAADPSCASEVHDSYPYAQGADEFLRINPEARVLQVAPSSPPVVRTVAWEDPDDEIDGVADAVRARIVSGTPPDRIAVVCFHPWWFARMGRALKERGVDAGGSFGPLVLRDDVRDLARSCALRVVTALRLIDDVQDSAAWRCWVGFGDYLGRSREIVPFREREQERDPHARFAEAAKRSPAAREFGALAGSCAGRTGSDLLERLTACLATDDADRARARATLRPLYALGEGATPRAMLDELERLQFFNAQAQEGGVEVVDIGGVAGRSFEVVYAAGFVNGLFPARRFFDLTQVSVSQQRRIEEADRRRAAMLAAAAESELVLSSFERVEQDFAERCRIKQDRIFVESDGTRYAAASLSVRARDLCAKHNS